MIGYITLGTNDFSRATAFYDELMKTLDIGRTMQDETFVVWGKSADGIGFSVTKPFDGNPATVGNGVMIALNVENQDKVKEVYRKAIELGATDEGEPGPRGNGGFYCGYFRDLDGNKLNIFCMG